MNRSRSLQPLALMLVFLGPLALAVIAFYGPWDWVPRTAAHGEFIEPPLPLPAGELTTLAGARTEPDWYRGRWSLIYARTSHCDEQCVAELNRLNQVRLALGEDLRRVQLVLLFAGTGPELPDGAALLAARLDDGAGTEVLELLGADSIGNGRIYLADPLGNLVMTYPPGTEQRGILEDLERLLTVTVIGWSGQSG